MSPEVPAYQQTVEEVLVALGADASVGLTEHEAQSRLKTHGRNELAADIPIPAWKKFLAQFQDALVIVLLIAAAISAVVVLNALMGYVRESIRSVARLCAPHELGCTAGCGAGATWNARHLSVSEGGAAQ